MKKKLTALLLTAAMLIPCISGTAAFADEPASAAEAATEEIGFDPAEADNSETGISVISDTSEENPVNDTTDSSDADLISDTSEENPIDEVSAEPTPNPELISDAVGVDITIAPHQWVIDSIAKFNLFDSKGNLVGTSEEWIGGDTNSVRLQFSVPPYEVGEHFTLGFVEGFKSLKYYSTTIAPGGSFDLETYAMRDENGSIIHGNNFAMDAEPNYKTAINLYYDNKQIPLWPMGQIVDGVGMVSAYDIGKAVGMKVEYHSNYNSLTMSMGSQQLIFNLGGTYSTFFGTDKYISHAPVWAGDAILVPLRDTLEALGCTINLWQSDDHIDVIADKSPVITQWRNKERVNREGIYSRTNYLVWVSKSDYRVKLYQGSQYNWECILDAPCAIGAPGTPTIEGQFEYQYNGGIWSYPNFYVSPTLVFYGGYALHSTLRAWGGGMYDDSVGVMISHGCVRLHPKDIDFIYKTIPIGTKVYVTP